jgi:hypothetical protein
VSREIDYREVRISRSGGAKSRGEITGGQTTSQTLHHPESLMLLYCHLSVRDPVSPISPFLAKDHTSVERLSHFPLRSHSDPKSFVKHLYCVSLSVSSPYHLSSSGIYVKCCQHGDQIFGGSDGSRAAVVSRWRMIDRQVEKRVVGRGEEVVAMSEGSGGVSETVQSIVVRLSK